MRLLDVGLGRVELALDRGVARRSLVSLATRSMPVSGLPITARPLRPQPHVAELLRPLGVGAEVALHQPLELVALVPLIQRRARRSSRSSWIVVPMALILAVAALASPRTRPGRPAMLASRQRTRRVNRSAVRRLRRRRMPRGNLVFKTRELNLCLVTLQSAQVVRHLSGDNSRRWVPRTGRLRPCQHGGSES